MPRGQRLKAQSNTVDDTWTWTSRRLHLVRRRFSMNATCDGEGQPVSGSPMTGCAIKPEIGPASHTRLVMCSETPRESKKGVPYLAWLRSEGSLGLMQSLVSPELDCPGNLGACHGYTEIEQIERREVTTPSIHFSSRDCGPAS
jgi:hypothetical protein